MQHMPIVEAVKKAFRSVVIIKEDPLQIATPNKAMSTLLAMGAVPTNRTYAKGKANWLIMEIPETVYPQIQELANMPSRSSSGGIKALRRQGRDVTRFTAENPAGEIIGEIMPINDTFYSVTVDTEEGEFEGRIERVNYALAYPEGTASTKKYAYVLVLDGERQTTAEGDYLPRGGGFNSFSSSLFSWLQGRDDEAHDEADFDDEDEE